MLRLRNSANKNIPDFNELLFIQIVFCLDLQSDTSFALCHQVVMNIKELSLVPVESLQIDKQLITNGRWLGYYRTTFQDPNGTDHLWEHANRPCHLQDDRGNQLDGLNI